MVVGDDGDVRADLHVVLQRDAADAHGGEAVVDENVLADGELLWEVDLAGRHDAEAAVVMPVEQLVQSLCHILRRRLRVVEAEQREVGATQFVDGGAIFRRQHIHRLAGFQLFKYIH